MKTLKLTIIALCVGAFATVNAQTANKAATPTTTTATTGQHLKKDGTPDMRYKDNKMKATPTTSPAMRANAAPAAKPATKAKAKTSSTNTTK